ncbi:MAG: aldo/keto reductase [Nitrospinae bacterium]|nr:aldo/keto reductase [Nitrospinota bacterium]
MEYRRFGKTEKEISVITLGGMRFPHGWDEPREELPKDSIDNCIEITQKAFDVGINHVESAWGYVKSEHLFGEVLSRLDKKRSEYYFMTKGTAEDEEGMIQKVKLQLQHLKMEYVDFYGFHGINTHEILSNVVKKGGALDGLLRLKKDGLIKHIGFSTHGPLNVIMDSVNTGLFEFVNLHYYYFYQRNYPVVALAKHKDLGVFIISPNDKGGQLWNASEKVKNTCKPLTPIQFNARFCLSHPEIATMSFGINELSQFKESLGVLNNGIYFSPEDREIMVSMDKMVSNIGENYCTYCSECLPCPEKINIPEILRFRNMAVGYDMINFGRYRYNMFEPDGHWFPGNFGNKCTDCNDCLSRCPLQLKIPSLLRGTHSLLYREKTP